uniref:Acetyl-CoA hydrolase n=1 Tax=Rhabditophanes sp. KR3021 TaxID=114890 RepID=A0AC35U4N6_9BILA
MSCLSFLSQFKPISRQYHNAVSLESACKILQVPLNKTNTPNYVSYEQALSLVKSGDSLYTQAAANSPTPLWKALVKRIDSGNLKDLSMHHIITIGETPWLNEHYYDKIRTKSLFICGNARPAIAQGKADYIPIFLSQMPQYFSQMEKKFDASLVSVSPPDEHGFVSMSLTVDCSHAALQNSKKVIGVVSKNLPRVFGDAIVHISHFDALVEDHSYEPFELPATKYGPQDPETIIGKLIAENLVDDEATLQFGIGGIPDSVCSFLTGHKNLGIHTELLCDGVYELIRDGVINGTKKSFDNGLHVSSFVIGTKRLYNLMNNNPEFKLKCSSYTNNVEMVAKSNKMTCVNSCIEMDLTGQIVSDSIGYKFYSGFGGQVDFITGAGMSYDNKGKAIIAMTSRTPKGISKIVPVITEGSGVVTNRGLTKYVVTEHGIANLFGKTIAQRAYELINISHPDDREKLEKATFKRLKCMPSKD